MIFNCFSYVFVDVQKRIPEVFSGDVVQRRAEPPPDEGEDDRDRQPLAEATAEGQGPLQEDRGGEAETVQSPAGAVVGGETGFD